MLKKKTNYEVTTKAKCLEDTATGQAGAVAYQTFKGEDVELSSAYHIPYHAICSVKVKTTTEEVEYDDPTCIGETPTPPEPVVPYFDGVHNASIHQGTEFSLTDDVKAYDGAGNEIPFTVEPSELDTCEVGQHHFTYTAEGVTAARTITVREIANPTISGIDTLVVEVNEEFDPLEGVSAVDGNGNEVEVTYEEPEQYVIMVDVSNYIAPNDNPLPTEAPFVWDGQSYICEAEGLLVDGVPANVTGTYTMNDTDVVVVLDNGIEIYFHDRGSGDSFTTQLYGRANEVTFERLIIKYLIEE